MIDLTPDAQAILESYQRQVRAYTSASGKADAEDVLRDVQEHLQRELHDAQKPVGGPKLQEVLGRLGSPSSWISEEDMPWWRRALLRAKVGPEDWRLAYATFGLVLVGLLFGWIFSSTSVSPYHSSHSFNDEAFILFVIASFFVARATLATARAPSLLPSAQRWLVYPSLIIVYAIIAVAILLWAPLVAGGIAFGVTYESIINHSHAAGRGFIDSSFYGPAGRGFVDNGFHGADAQALAVAILAGAVVGGIWWIVLSLLMRSRAGQVLQFIFLPFLDRHLRTIAKVLLIAGIVLIVLGAGSFAIVA